MSLSNRVTSTPILDHPDPGGKWPLFRCRASDRPMAMISAADLGLSELESSPFWRLDPPTRPTLDIHLAGHTIAVGDLTRFIIDNRYDQIADYDVFYELVTGETTGNIAELLIASTHGDRGDIGGWAVLKRSIEDPHPTDPRASGQNSRYTIELANVFVIPEFRGFGVGRALVHAALRLVKGDLTIMAAGQHAVTPTFHAECVSKGGEALALQFSSAIGAFIANLPTETFDAFETIIE